MKGCSRGTRARVSSVLRNNVSAQSMENWSPTLGLDGVRNKHQCNPDVYKHLLHRGAGIATICKTRVAPVKATSQCLPSTLHHAQVSGNTRIGLAMTLNETETLFTTIPSSI
ncbi:hypothetical protein PTI98_009216 [Pleurotus ostreatus]|nr:hypothetical protein PTI98_009216 [Pleurotus ostreatus]